MLEAGAGFQFVAGTEGVSRGLDFGLSDWFLGAFKGSLKSSSDSGRIAAKINNKQDEVQTN